MRLKEEWTKQNEEALQKEIARVTAELEKEFEQKSSLAKDESLAEARME